MNPSHCINVVDTWGVAESDNSGGWHGVHEVRQANVFPNYRFSTPSAHTESRHFQLPVSDATTANAFPIKISATTTPKTITSETGSLLPAKIQKGQASKTGS